MIPGQVPTTTVRQADIAPLRDAYRLTGYPIVVRVERQQMGGGFGDQDRHPYAWGVVVQVDGQWLRIQSARGTSREWTNLDRLEKWLRSLGFRHFWVQNEIDPVEEIGEDPDDPRPALK